MNSDDYRHFVAIVAGDNPESLMLPYDSMKEVEPYVVYKYADAESIKDKYLKMLSEICFQNTRIFSLRVKNITTQTWKWCKH